MIKAGKRFGRWLVEKLVDAIVCLVDFLFRVWRPKLKIRKEK